MLAFTSGQEEVFLIYQLKLFQ